MSVIVTGGAGFIGSALVRGLVRDGIETITIDSLTYAGNRDNLPKDSEPLHTFAEIDICDIEALRQLFAQRKPVKIYHLAAESHVDRSIDGPLEFVRTNVLGTACLLQAAREYWQGLPEPKRSEFRFLHVSTDEVFGELGAEGLFDEDSPYAPNSPYAATKAGSDHLVRAWIRTYGFPALLSNCSNNYGPFQFPEKLIPLMVQNSLEAKPLPVYGQGLNVRDWLYVDDHADALRTIVDDGRIGETYLVSGRAERRNIDVVKQVCAIMDEMSPLADGRSRDSLIQFVDDRPGHDARYAIDPGKIEAELGWRAKTDFNVGLRKTIEWYLQNQQWCSHALTKYRQERLGLTQSA